LLDCSSSMSEQQLDLAKAVLAHVVQAFHAGCNCGLRVFGQSERRGSVVVDCADSKLVVPIDQMGQSKMRAAIADVHPTGVSCLCYGIRKAIDDIIETNQEGTVFILTCEKDSCKGDITGLWSADLRNSKTKFVVFSTSQHCFSEGKLQDTRILAHETGGKYYDSASLGELYKDLSTFGK
jgi:von Willebrand factor type A domain